MAGPSQSKSSSSSDQSTTITETTTTTIGDIGLTGDAAIGIVEALTLGAVAQAQSFADLVAPLVEIQEKIFSTPKGQEIASGEEAKSSNLPLIIAGLGAAALVWGMTK